MGITAGGAPALPLSRTGRATRKEQEGEKPRLPVGLQSCQAPSMWVRGPKKASAWTVHRARLLGEHVE